MSAAVPRIVCATDLTVAAAGAAEAAAALASRWPGTLELLHVATAAGREAGSAPAAGRLAAAAERLRGGGLAVKPVLARGFPVGATLLEQVRRDPPALVVLASARRGPLDRWAFGSVAEEVAQGAPVPTLVVRDAGVLTRWPARGPGLSVFAAIDLQAATDGVLQWIRGLRRLGPCTLTVCHLNPVVPPAGAGAAEPPANPPRLQARLEREVRKRVRDVLGDDDTLRVVVQPVRFRSGGRLVELARAAGADLIVIGTHQRHGLSRLFHASVSRAVLHEAATNVACVPVTAPFDPRDAHLPEYRRVLVATDFSALGNAAVPHAGGVCALGGLVRIVHVILPPEAGGAAAERRRAEVKARLAALVPAELGARTRPAECVVLEAEDPARALCAEAERFGADLVVIASHGLGGAKAVFGSVTQRVLKHLRRPVLVVRRPDEAAGK